MAKIVVFGDFNVDLVIFLERLPTQGETLNGTDFFQGAGGKGSNQAIAAARLNADVTFLGAIGDDSYGKIAKQAWAESNVNTDYLIEDASYNTGAALINVDARGENFISVYQGANLKITEEQITQATDAIKQADIVMCTLGIAPERVQQVFRIAQAHSRTTILNPAPAIPLSPEFLSLVDYLTPNHTELATVAGQSATEMDSVALARQIIQRDDQTVIVTRGADGVQWITASDTGTSPSFKVDVVDTVGAGDAFNAGFAVALAEGNTLTDALRFGNATAALAVQKVGAVDGMPQRADVEAFISQ